jgi:TetR/AcrR family transcriptional regulator
MGTKDRKQTEKENRRELILEAAEKVMQQNGLHGLSIDSIAHETRLATGTIYLYFKNKEEILSVLTIKARDMILKEFEKVAEGDENNIEKLKSIVRANYLFYKNHPMYYDLISLYDANNKFTETEGMYKSSENITKLVVSITNSAKEDGVLNPTIDPLHFTTCLYGMTTGMLQIIKVRGLLMQDRLAISEDELLRTFIEILENGIKK